MAPDETALLIVFSCTALAFLVYLMWRSATAESWKKFTAGEKSEWRSEEARRKN
ncbi:MAG: hypothetical protein WC588_03560 [Candidatus Micrarchaeia archaeon]